MYLISLELSHAQIAVAAVLASDHSNNSVHRAFMHRRPFAPAALDSNCCFVGLDVSVRYKIGSQRGLRFSPTTSGISIIKLKHQPLIVKTHFAVSTDEVSNLRFACESILDTDNFDLLADLAFLLYAQTSAKISQRYCGSRCNRTRCPRAPV